jgi:hypothetical protein
VEVLGGNVPQGPQPYALVVDGVFGAVDTPPSVSIDGETLADGTVTFNSGKVKSGGTFTFRVDDVVKSGYIYDPGLNAETSDAAHLL